MSSLGRVVAVIAGLVVTVEGAALTFNVRGATDWWIDYAARQRELFGRMTGPGYDRDGTRWLGMCSMLVGVLILAVAIFA